MTDSRVRGGDLGSGTIFALVLVAVLATIVLGSAAVGGSVVARHRAMAAADLAALAAADALARADPEPCAKAEQIALVHGVDLVDCRTSGLVVDVVVGAPVRGVLGFGLVAEMCARAGPGGFA